MSFKDVIKTINPIDNSIEFNSTVLKWKINPSLNNINFDDIKESVKDTMTQSKIHIEFKQDFKDANVELKVKIDGKVESFTFGEGKEPLAFDLNLKKEFTESDITIQLNINGNSTIFTSPSKSDAFKATFSLNKLL